MKKLFLSIFATMLAGMALKANNIQLSGIALNGQNTTSDFTLVNFNVSWENSWRTSTNESNYDGAWIFVKFRKKNSSNWQHATINYVSPGTAAASGHTQPVGSILKTASDGKGVWIYRNGFGTGNNTFNGAKLRWNYGVDGVLDNDSVEVRVFANEMVYIPQGAFNLGSGGSETYHFRDGAVDTYFPITSENAITAGNSAGNLYTDGGSYWYTGTVPASHPKGFNAFWIMKYEMSQQQYVDFLNTIDYNKAVNRVPPYYVQGSHPNYTAQFPEKVMNYIGAVDVLSYLDWAALRPFTEFEFEKACRGSNQVPIANEFAWGNTTISAPTGAVNQNTDSETYTTGNCNYTILPNSTETMRCGALATGTSTRTSSGATYYGVMEMSGNAWEWAATAYELSGRNFTGNHGDGNLAANGDYNSANWPNPSSGGLGVRGGAWGNGGAATGTIRISDRTYGSYAVGNSRYNNIGGRGARTGE
jgi:formylglycine-generating enzyme required for sulfatase activity